MRPQMRRLQSWHPGIKRRYQILMVSQLHRHRVKQKLLRIRSNIRVDTEAEYRESNIDKDRDNFEDFNGLDKIITNAMMHAEFKCRKIRTGKVPFSPAVSRAGRMLSLWGLLLWYHSGHKTKMWTIRLRAMGCGVLHPFLFLPSEVGHNQLEARAIYSRLKHNASWQRIDYIE